MKLLWPLLVLFPALAGAPANRASPPAPATIDCAVFIYARGRQAAGFSERFLAAARRETGLPLAPRLVPARLGRAEALAFPAGLLAGEGDFALAAPERARLDRYLAGGGFLIASASCGDAAWDRSFRRELAALAAPVALEPLPATHPAFTAVNDLAELPQVNGEPGHLEGLYRAGRLVGVYCPQGLNDSARVPGSCCCDGGELRDAEALLVNLVVYALVR